MIQLPKNPNNGNTKWHANMDETNLRRPYIERKIYEQLMMMVRRRNSLIRG